MSSRRPLFSLASLFFCVISAIPCVAPAEDASALAVHGFATQGFVQTSANRFFGDSEQGSFDLTELGINATFEPVSNARVSGQLLSRRAGEMYDGSPEIDFLLADLTLRSSDTGSISLLAGRIKNPLGLFNETRDIAFTRPGFQLPQVIYFDKVRNLIMSSDGIGARIDWYGQHANIGVYFSASRPVTDENIEYGFLGTGFAGDFEADGLSYVARLQVASPDDRLRAAFSMASLSLDFPRAGQDPLGDGSLDLLYTVASLQFSTERWTFTTEYMRQPTEWHGFANTPFADIDAVAEGYFLQLAWRFANDWEWMLRYEDGVADRADRSGRELEQATFGMVPAHTRYSRIIASGIRWDISPSLMLRAEYQRHNGTFILSSRENPSATELVPDWELFAMSLSYRF